MKTKVISFSKKESSTVDLDKAIFGLPVRKDILHRVINWQLAKRRGGTRKTKGISEIQGTTAKPFRQKGTGNARQGSKYAPHMRGGSVIFGPVVRDHGHNLPKKVRKLGLKTALSEKAASGKLLILDSGKFSSSKTSELTKKLEGLGLSSVLIIDDKEVDANLYRAAGNLHKVDLLPQAGANVYDIVRHEHVVLTKDAVKTLEERLKND